MLEVHDRISMGGGLTKDTMLLGVSPAVQRCPRPASSSPAASSIDQDATAHAKVAVLNQPLANELFGSAQAAIDQTITIKGIPFTVIGVFKESIDTYGMSEISDQTILIPYEVARYFTGTDTVKEIFFKMANSSQVEPAAMQITALIQSRHRPTSVYHAQTLTAILNTMGKIADMLTIVLTARRRHHPHRQRRRHHEQHARQRPGAHPRDRHPQGARRHPPRDPPPVPHRSRLPLALRRHHRHHARPGIPLSVRLLTPFKIPVDWRSAVIALATSVIVGVIFGTVPANRAARLDPVETLKYE